MMFGHVDSITSNLEIVSLEEVKQQLRFNDPTEPTEEDDFLNRLIEAAGRSLESFTNRQLSEATIVEVFTPDKVVNPLRLTVVKLLNVERVEIIQDGENIIINPATYRVNPYQVPGEIIFKQLPALSMDDFTPLKVVYKAGTTEPVPEPLKQAALMLIGHLYENRQEVVVGKLASELPKASEFLAAPYVLQMI